MSTFWQHYLNPLHIFCRLREVGIPKTIAIFLCQFYERAIFYPLLGNKRKLKNAVVNVHSREPMSNGSWLK
jgi:hypothetical protein